MRWREFRTIEEINGRVDMLRQNRILASLLVLGLNSASAIPNADFDEDGMVSFPDFFLFAESFESFPGDDNWDARCDMDGNGSIGFPDFFYFATYFDGGYGTIGDNK